MAGFFIYAIAGIGFLTIAAIDSLSFAFPLPRFLPFLLTSFLSILSIANSILTSLSSSSSDPIGSPIPLSSLPVSALFLIFSISSLLPLPNSLLDLLSLSAFIQQFLLFRLRNNKDPDGLENRYFDLLLVPISICASSSLLAIARPRSPFPRLTRAAGIALQGSWFLQMAFSLFTSLVAYGCDLRLRSRSNFTVGCRGHADMHRGSAIATLQFNCHLAFLVAVAVGGYAVLVGRRRGVGEYRPIGKELRRMEHVLTSNFTLDSDDDDEEMDMDKQREVVSVPVNGFGGTH